MKKIIAAAVATAFVAPAFAANENFTLSGDMEYMYQSGDVTNRVSDGGQIIVFSGSTETNNGWTVTGTTNIMNTEADIASDGGTSIKVAGGFGSITVGDASGALDNTGDYSDVSPVAGGYAYDGSDASILYVAPALVDGLKVSISHTPEGPNFAGNAEMDSYSVAYSFSGGEVYYGTQNVKDSSDTTAYGVKASFGGLMVALEMGTNESDDATVLDTDATGIAATYTLGSDTTLAVEKQSTESAASGDVAVTETDVTVVSVTQSFGGGLSVYAEQANTEVSGSTADTDVTSIGVVYKF
jgi:hypothetical protein